jgi:hypothetical protein
VSETTTAALPAASTPLCRRSRRSSRASRNCRSVCPWTMPPARAPGRDRAAGVRRVDAGRCQKPQLIERVLELSRLQSQFVLQDRHLAEQGGEVDRPSAQSSAESPSGSPSASQFFAARSRPVRKSSTRRSLSSGSRTITGDSFRPQYPQQPPLGRTLRNKIAADGAQHIVHGRRGMVEQLVCKRRRWLQIAS